MPIRAVRAALIFAALAVLLAAAPARADRVVYQQGDALYLLDEGRPPVKLSSLGQVLGPLWALSPDGSRIAWAVRGTTAAAPAPPAPKDPVPDTAPGGAKLNEEGEGAVSAPTVVPATAPKAPARPPAPASSLTLTVYTADVPGGKPRRLLATDALLDRQGRAVTALSAAVPARLDRCEPVSLGWSADGKTLYLGFVAAGALGAGRKRGPATVAADAVTGSPLVDAAGHWRVLAPVTHTSARGARLVGLGDAGASPMAELLVTNLAEGSRTVLPGGSKNGWSAPRDPALSPPDGARIAFTATPRGLYLADAASATPVARRVVTGDVARPRWSADGRRLFFLVPRPGVGEGRVLYDLFSVAVPESTAGAWAQPRRVYERIDTFDAAAVTPGEP